MRPTLRPYQVQQLLSIGAALKTGTNRVLIKSPTGTGKTVMFSQLLNYLAEQPKTDAGLGWLEQFTKRGAQLLVIAHREELLTQAAEKIRAANPGLIVAIEQGDLRAPRAADVIVASIQTLAAVKFRRLLRLQAHHDLRVVVVDEAHHAAARTYRGVLEHLKFLPPTSASQGTTENIDAPEFDDIAEMEKALANWDATSPKDRLLVGVTATPNRSDAVGLGCVFQSIVYSYNLKDAISDGYLVPIQPWCVESDTSLDDVSLNRGEFNQRELAEAVNQQRRNDLAVASWRQYANNLSTLAFTVDVAHAHDLAATFQAAGVEAYPLSGETPKDERRQLLADFTAGKVKVITNCMVLTEGTDLPLTGCILHAKPTKSATLYEQMTGRGLRPFAGKDKCIVVDIVDIAKRHSLQTAPVLYGLPPSLVSNGKDLGTVEGELEALRQKYPFANFDELTGKHLTLEQLGAWAQSFDVWTVPELGAFGSGRAMNWLKVGEDVYRLQYPWEEGTETLQVSKDLVGHWDLAITFRPHAVGFERPVARQRTIGAGILTADAAAGLAEAFVLQERRQVARLKDKDAPWRSRPASPKQLQLLSKRRVPHDPKTLTMGQASDLIDLAMARRGR